MWKNFSLFDFVARLVCLVAGLAVAAAALTKVLPKYGVEVPGIVASYVPSAYYSTWGWGGSEIAAAAGLFLALMTFSRHLTFRIFVLIGVILLVLQNPIIRMVGQPQLTEQRVFWGGVVLVAFGFGYRLFNKLRGARF